MFEPLHDRLMLDAAGLAAALPLALNAVTADQIALPGQVDLFRFELTESGRMSLHTRSTEAGFDTRTSLLGPAGELLIASDANSRTDPDDLIVQHLLPDTYYVRVESPAGGSGAYSLVVRFQPATPPEEPSLVNFDRDYPFGLSPPFHAAADFNGDGILDLATANSYTNDVSVLLGVGDGAFQESQHYRAGFYPLGLVAEDLNLDGRFDLAVANQFSNDVSILLGRGDGTFADEFRVSGGTSGWGIGTGDLNEDGWPDLLVSNLGTDDVSILLGRGSGTFAAELRFAVGNDPVGHALADLDRDGHLDIVTANFESNDVSVLLGHGDGTFQPERRFAVGNGPTHRIAVGDFDGDDRLDLATSNSGSSDVSVLLGRGDGTFVGDRRFAVGASPFGVVAFDFDGDGVLDLANVNRASHDVSLLLGRGDGTFQDHVRYRVGLQPWNILVGDMDGDGRVDLTTANSRSHDISLLLGLGDGTFQRELTDHGHGETNPQGMVARDFNHDGLLDLVTISYTGGDAFVFLGRGDGTFQERARFATGATPVEVVAVDFNGDGHLDLATANCDSSDVSVLLGRGDGTFGEQARYPASASGEFILAGDFNGDTFPDLVVSGQFAKGAALLLGRGDGTFQERILFAQGDASADSAAADFNQDGFLDVAFTNHFSIDPQVSVYLGRGDGTFRDALRLPVGAFPLGLIAGDLDADGHADLAATNFGAASVSVIRGRGDGTFDPEIRLASGPLPDSILAGDTDGDGRLDLVVSNAGANDLSLFLGGSDGTFASQQRFLVGDGPTPRRGLEVGDFNDDGRLDLALPQVISNDVSILLGQAGGQFSAPLRFAVGLGPAGMTVGDFSGDGRLDVASVNPTTHELHLAFGAPGATLRRSQRYTVGTAPVAVAQGDFNRDGRLDVATANQGSHDVSILLGLGTNALRGELRFPVGNSPIALVTGDFNGDRVTDLATANAGSNDVSLLFGLGDGAFRRGARVAGTDLPQALVAGDFNRDGRLDLATANYRSQDLSIFLGLGDGSFAPAVRVPLGTAPGSLLADDLNDDGLIDLITSNFLSHDVSVLEGREDGLFATPVRYPTGAGPLNVVSGDFDGNGRTDLATANSLSDDVTFLLQRGDGTYAPSLSRPVGDYPVSLLAVDLNEDARQDLVVATHLAADLTVLQGLGDATFAPAGTLSDPRPSTPLVADLNGDGSPDVAVLTLSGQILVRHSRPNEPGFFESPIVVNPDPQFAARDLAVVRVHNEVLLAALNAKNASLSFYSRAGDGTFQTTAGPGIPGTLPVAIKATDLNGDGREDLVVAAAGSNNVFVFLQVAPHSRLAPNGFSLHAPDRVIDVGISPSAIEFADMNQDGKLEIVVTNQYSGDVSVLRGEPASGEAVELRFRAGPGLYSLLRPDDQPLVRSIHESVDVVAGHFDEDSWIDLAVVNRRANSFAVLQGSGQGGVVNPDRARTYATDIGPTVAVTGQFNADAFLDLAILNEGNSTLSIYLGDGRGGFVEKRSTDAGSRLSSGNLPGGLAVHDVNADGRLDLLVGNEFGDLLTLLGNGDGTFEPYERVGLDVALVIADLNGDGRDDFVFSNQSQDRVSIQYSQPGRAFEQQRSHGLLAPGAVATADLNVDGFTDLVVANSGANDLLVYLGKGAGEFGPATRYFAGTMPVGVTIEDLNADRLPDLVVANQGSNDVTVLLGQLSASGWTLTSGPRLRAGSGPVATLVQDANGDQILDILVTNRLSRDVYVLPGVGQGFFDDRQPMIRATGPAPTQIFPVGNGVATLDRDGLTYFPDIARAPGVSFLSGGRGATAAVAGDFNFDGRGDLMVAHHDGVVSLLVGDARGQFRRESISNPHARHPVALAASLIKNAFEIYVVDEGRESAILLASFGISLPPPPRLIPNLLNVLLLAGPAVTVSAEILTTSERLEAIRDDLSSADPESPGDYPGGNGSHSDRPISEEESKVTPRPVRKPAVNALLLGIDDAIRRSLRQVAGDDALLVGGDRDGRDSVFAVIGQFLADWLTAADDLVSPDDRHLWASGVAGMLSGTLGQVRDAVFELLGKASPGDATDVNTIGGPSTEVVHSTEMAIQDREHDPEYSWWAAHAEMWLTTWLLAELARSYWVSRRTSSDETGRKRNLLLAPR